MNPPASFTDRSSILSYQRCPQRRFIEKHWDGKGITPDSVAVPLATGGAIHLGNQRLLEGASTDEAVQDVLKFYKDQVKAAGLQDTPTKDQEYTIKEQLALSEVMVRAWALKRLPLFQEKYNTIEVEREAPPTQLAPGVWLLRRPDGVLENRITGFYEVLSFKTAKYYSFKNDANNIVDVQGISESWAVAQKYGEEKLGPVVMEFLVTGPRKMLSGDYEDAPKDELVSHEFEDYDVEVLPSGLNIPRKVQWNPLIRAWRDNYGNISWRYKMPAPDNSGKMPTMAKFFNPEYGKKPKKGEVLPPYEVKSFAVWEEMPVKEWFDYMVDCSGPYGGYGNKNGIPAPAAALGYPIMSGVFPGWCDPFENMFIMRKYNRLPFETAEWQREAAAQETRIAEAIGELSNRSIHPLYRERLMNDVFPKYRHSCEYPTVCPFKKICWQGVSDPLSAGFKYRTPNHPEELNAVPKV